MGLFKGFQFFEGLGLRLPLFLFKVQLGLGFRGSFEGVLIDCIELA